MTTLVVPATVAVAASGALWLLGRGGWPGETGASAWMFCEAFRPGLVQQPANTFSNAGFVLAALAVGWRARRDLAGAGTAPRNRMTAGVFFPACYAGVAAFLGPGSAAMHASTTAWGGRVDVFSMYLWILWVLAYQWLRLRGGGRREFLGVWLPAVVGLGVPHLAGWIPFSSDLLFGALIAGAVVFECALARRRSAPPPGRAVAAGACFLAAFAIWIPSRTGGPLCDPDSLLQGHAAWHLLCAASVWLLYCYARVEPETPPASSAPAAR